MHQFRKFFDKEQIYAFKLFLPRELNFISFLHKWSLEVFLYILKSLLLTIYCMLLIVFQFNIWEHDEIYSQFFEKSRNIKRKHIKFIASFLRNICFN